jgi:hypothetical protein
VVKLNYGEIECYSICVHGEVCCNVKYDSPYLKVSGVEIPVSMLSYFINELKRAINTALSKGDMLLYSELSQDYQKVQQAIANPNPTSPPPQPITVPIAQPPKEVVAQPVTPPPETAVSPPPLPPPITVPAPSPAQPQPELEPEPEPQIEKKEEEEEKKEGILTELAKFFLMGLILHEILKK